MKPRGDTGQDGLYVDLGINRTRTGWPLAAAKFKSEWRRLTSQPPAVGTPGQAECEC